MMTAAKLTERMVRGRFDHTFSSNAQAAIAAGVAHLQRHNTDTFPRAHNYTNVYMSLRRLGVISWSHAERMTVDGVATFVHFYRFTNKALGEE